MPRTHCHRLELRCGDDLLAVLERQKAATGASYSEIIRRGVLGMPPPPPLLPPLSKWDQSAVESLGRIGVNLNQIAKRMHQVPGAPISQNEFAGLDMALVGIIRYTLGLIDKMAVIDEFRFSQPKPPSSPTSSPS